MVLRPVCFALVAFFACLQYSFACEGGKLQFDDDFTNPDPSWNRGNVSVDVGEGRAILKPRSGTSVWMINPAFFFTDVTTCVDVKMPDTASDTSSAAAAGLIFWSTPGNTSFYGALVSPLGTYSVLRFFNQSWVIVVPPTASSAIKASAGDVNEIQIQLMGTSATLSINGSKAVSFRGQRPDVGSNIGLYAASAGSKDSPLWQFNHVRVLDPQ